MSCAYHLGKLADVVRDYTQKGSLLYIEGKLQTRKRQNQQGQDRYTTEVVLDVSGKLIMLDSKKQHINTNAGNTQTPATIDEDIPF